MRDIHATLRRSAFVSVHGEEKKGRRTACMCMYVCVCVIPSISPVAINRAIRHIYGNLLYRCALLRDISCVKTQNAARVGPSKAAIIQRTLSMEIPLSSCLIYSRTRSVLVFQSSHIGVGIIFTKNTNVAEEEELDTASRSFISSDE